MLTNDEIRQILEDVEAGTYTIEDALNDIATAQRGEDVRKALYAEAITLNKEGKAGSVDLQAREGLSQEITDRETADTQTKADCDAAIKKVSDKVDSIFGGGDSGSGPFIRRVSYIYLPDVSHIGGDYSDGGLDAIYVNSNGAVTIDYGFLYKNESWAKDYRPFSINFMKKGTLTTRLVVGFGCKVDDSVLFAEWNGVITLFNPLSTNNILLSDCAVEIFFIRRDMISGEGQ